MTLKELQEEARYECDALLKYYPGGVYLKPHDAPLKEKELKALVDSLVEAVVKKSIAWCEKTHGTAGYEQKKKNFLNK